MNGPDNQAETDSQTPVWKDIRESHAFEENKASGVIRVLALRDSQSDPLQNMTAAGDRATLTLNPLAANDGEI